MSNNEAMVQSDEVCWHYTKGERVHIDECTCLLCAGLDLDAICYQSLPERNVSHASASINADGQSSNTCAGNLQHCWAPHSARPVWPRLDSLQQPPTKKYRLEVDDQPASAGETHSASADVDVDMDVDMVDQFAKITLDSEAMER
jgi:hypothetical protein